MPTATPIARPEILIEVAIGSADDARIAEAAGADRLELNSALALGGLTPSIGLAEATREATNLPIIAMIRPRPGGFDYRPGEIDAMIRDIAHLSRVGVDGFTFGVLDADGRVALDRNRTLIAAAGDRPAVFHRAFDVTPDPFEALEALVGLGFRRVLTSGQEPAAPLGVPLLAELRRRAAGRIAILPGGGVRLDNVLDLIDRSGCDQIHGSFRTTRRDASALGRPAICFEPGRSADPGRVDATDGRAVAAVVAALAGRGRR